MRKANVAVLSVAFGLFAAGASAGPGPTPGTFDLGPGAAGAGSWQELLWGGNEGKPGNELEASSDLYEFEGATLELVTAANTPGEYFTVYKGGELTLYNVPEAPWYNPDKNENKKFKVAFDWVVVHTTKGALPISKFVMTSPDALMHGGHQYSVSVQATFGPAPVSWEPAAPPDPARIFGELSSARIIIQKLPKKPKK